MSSVSPLLDKANNCLTKSPLRQVRPLKDRNNSGYGATHYVNLTTALTLLGIVSSQAQLRIGYTGFNYMTLAVNNI